MVPTEPKPEGAESSSESRIAALDARAKELEEELRQRKALMDAMLEASYDGLCLLSCDGIFLEMNAAFERVTGLKRSEWLGKTIEEMRRVPGMARRSAALQVMEGVWPATTLVNVAGGEMLLVTANPHLGPNGEVLNIILNVRNITHLNYLKYQLERGRGEAKVADIEKFRVSFLQNQLRAAGLGDVVVASPIMANILSTAEQIAGFDSTILLCGETGTGKGVVAKFIHRLSGRAKKPFVEVNCGAIPEGLVESELFGYEPGAFTGSLRSGKKGQFELANGGTLFLDEIAELPLGSQTKLLQFLDDKVVHRVGGTSPRRVEVRIIAATNKNLREQAETGRFRRDLLYRLEVIPLYIPPLRERPEDIKALLYSFLDQFNREFHEKRAIASEAMAALFRYSYPGNVRELKNIMARLVLTTGSNVIGVEALPDYVREAAPAPSAPSLVEKTDFGETIDLHKHLEDVERAILAHYAARCRSTYEIADRTGIHQSSVVRKLKKYKIPVAPGGSRE